MIFFAGIESLVPILIFAAFALLARWLKSKAQKESADEYHDLPRGPQPHAPSQRQRQQPKAPPVSRSKSWEEELRDLLENRQAPPPVRRDVPPPIVYAPPPPLPSYEEEGALSHTTALEKAHLHVRAALRETDARLEHASKLQQRIAHRFQEGAHRHGKVAFVHHAERSATIRRAVQLVQDRDGLRAAMVASVILGPPRGLDEVR
ncbi:MAG TPA: hypothetical protein VK530_13165 [Candidatus Acidoferrum sp.]|nr:hypothetical protein [Candidatus Acidoferrum sp.]